ncbi:MAG: NTP transferase domain-containing protein [Bacteroidota bacterium]
MIIKSEHEIKPVGAIILAAGFSSRMKIPKPFLRFDEKRVFIEKIIDNFMEFGCSKIIITTNEQISEWTEIKNKFENCGSVLFIANRHPEFERFFSIKTGLANIRDLEQCFIHNADNPFIEKDILNLIYDNRTDNGYTVPCCQNSGGHPVLLSKKVLKKIIEEENININFKDFLKGFPRKDVEVFSDKIQININTQDEYDRYFK